MSTVHVCEVCFGQHVPDPCCAGCGCGTGCAACEGECWQEGHTDRASCDCDDEARHAGRACPTAVWVEAASAALGIKLDLPPGWGKSTPNGPWEGE